MKVMAIASASAALTPDQIQKHLPNEVPATLRLSSMARSSSSGFVNGWPNLSDECRLRGSG